MKCPTCGENTPDAWQQLVAHPNYAMPQMYELQDPEPEIRQTPYGSRVQLDWMFCASKECGQLVVRGHDTYTRHENHGPVQDTRTWGVYPRHRTRPISPLVPEDMAHDFGEAAAILDVSHRMSAVLARRILADVLEKYAGLDQYGLTDRIDAFIADENRPHELRQNLHYLREIADFGAHTQKDDQLDVLNVTEDEAEWTLDVVERLFDYFIVGPEKDRKMRESMKAKMEKAGRKAIESPDSEVPSGTNGGEEAEDREDSEGVRGSSS